MRRDCVLSFFDPSPATRYATLATLVEVTAVSGIFVSYSGEKGQTCASECVCVCASAWCGNDLFLCEIHHARVDGNKNSDCNRTGTGLVTAITSNTNTFRFRPFEPYVVNFDNRKLLSVVFFLFAKAHLI